MRVSELAKQLNITIDTVRYYTRIGLLKPMKDPCNGYKHYRKNDELRLRFILKAKALGLTIDEIQTIVTIADKGQSPCCMVKQLVRSHITETEQKISQLQRLKANMQRAVAVWESIELPQGEDESVCVLIEQWDAIETAHASSS